MTHHQYGISALIPHMENSDGDPKCWLFSQATTNTPFDFHIFFHYLQVDKLKLSNLNLNRKLVQTKNEVEVQRNDPSSPLHSVKSFEELPL